MATDGYVTAHHARRERNVVIVAVQAQSVAASDIGACVGVQRMGVVARAMPAGNGDIEKVVFKAPVAEKALAETVSA
jgi:hypothetical protein